MKSTRRMGTYQPKVYKWKRYSYTSTPITRTETLYHYYYKYYETGGWAEEAGQPDGGWNNYGEPWGHSIEEGDYWWTEDEVRGEGVTPGESYSFSVDNTDPDEPYPKASYQDHYSWTFIESTTTTVVVGYNYQKGDYVDTIKDTDVKDYTNNSINGEYWYELVGG